MRGSLRGIRVRRRVLLVEEFCSGVVALEWGSRLVAFQMESLCFVEQMGNVREMYS
jgi:hypothetical protein